MTQFISFIVKETRHIFRDKRTMLILFGMPVVMMLLLGFALSTEVRNVRTIVVTSSSDNKTQELVEALNANEYFNVTHVVNNSQSAELLIREQKADVAIVFCQRFSSATLSDNTPLIQIITDGTDPNMAQMYANYATQIISSHLMPEAKTSFEISSSLLYNPQMKSCYNFVPGIMGMLQMLICAMMTSISIVREKERGTMEVLLVSPVRPLTIIISKVIPYLVLAFGILTAILLISHFILDVPIACNVLYIYIISGVYVMVALSLGMLISTVAKTQLVALLMSAMMLILPCLLLSGMIFPVETMPKVLQWVSAIMPPRYYIEAIRKLMIMGVGLDKVASEMAVLGFMAAFLLTAALKKFNKRLA